MPLVQITMLRGRTDEQKRVLLEAVTEAVQRSIDAPLDSIRVWVNEIEPTGYMAAGELAADRRPAPGTPPRGDPGRPPATLAGPSGADQPAPPVEQVTPGPGPGRPPEVLSEPSDGDQAGPG
jgi:4-oxalocrotonate tautomerase